MKLLEVFRNDSSKFFTRNSACRTIKGGYVYFEDKRVFVPSETKMTIEHFDLYTNRVLVLIDGRQRASVTYEYLMDCVVPINVDVSQVVNGVQLLQRVRHVLDNETLVKIICLFVIFAIGLLIGNMV